MSSFEPLLFTALLLNSAGLVANLTREKQGIVVHEIAHRYAINIQLPRWLGFAETAPRPLVERVDW